MPHLRLGAAGALALAVLAAAPCRAQVDPSGPWRTLHTSHFRIHFRPVYRGLALIAANEAERAWSLLHTAMKTPPRGIIDLTMSDDADVANGYASPVPSNRMTVFLTPPSDEASLQHYDSWLRIVIVHELAHLFHLDRAGGIWRLMQTILGRAPGTFPNSYQPSWVTEGIATYYESRFTRAGRVSGELHNEILAAQAADSNPRTPWDAVFYTPWPSGLAPYSYGSQFLAWASDNTAGGDSLVSRFARATSRQLIPFRVGRQYKRVTGRELATDWAAATRPTAATPNSAGELVVGALRQAPAPRVSSDGRRVAYLHDDGRRAPELRIVEREGWRLLRAHRVNGGTSFDWDGDTLLVTQLDFTSRHEIRSDLYSWLPDGKWQSITHGRRATVPRAGGGVRSWIDITPGGHQPYIDNQPLADTAGTSWGALAPSPDGRTIAATRHRDGHWSLVRWPTAAPDRDTVLLESEDVIADPVWDAAGALYFVTSVAGLSQVHRWTGAAGGPVVVTTAPFGARGPAPEPGGTFLYSTLSGDGWELRRSGARAAVIPAVVVPPPAFEPADPVPARETGYVWWPSARPHYWLPLYADVGAAGRFFGLSTSGTDAVGRISYFGSVMGSADPGRALGGLFVVSEALGNPTLDVGASSNWSLVGVTSTGIAVSEQESYAALGATFVTRRWRTGASLRLAIEGEGSRFSVEPNAPIDSVCQGCVDRDFVGASVSVRLSHFISAPLSVSAQDGFVWSALYRRREVQGTRGWSGELQTRLNLYASFPRVGFARPVLAARIAGGFTHGPVPLFFSAGGVSSSVLDIGFGVRLGTGRAFPVRGYLPGDMRGSNAITTTAELRWPLALVGRSFGHLPAGVDRVWLALFRDAGDAWEADGRPQLGHLVGVGGELAADLRVSYDLPLRVRFGAAYPVGDMTVPAGSSMPRAAAWQVYVTLGADF